MTVAWDHISVVSIPAVHGSSAGETVRLGRMTRARPAMRSRIGFIAQPPQRMVAASLKVTPGS
jgi:hypothetical protein